MIHYFFCFLVKRDEIFSNINKLISHLNDATYYPMGLTILYVPREKIFCSEKKMINYTHGYKEDTKENNNNLLESNMREQDKSGLIERLERVARYWVKQIRQVLRGSNIPTTSACRSIIDEINFWNYRCKHLKYIFYYFVTHFSHTYIDIYFKYL